MQESGDTHIYSEKPSVGQASAGARIWNPWLAGKGGGHRVWLQCGERPRGDHDATESALGAAGKDQERGLGQAAVIIQDWVAAGRGDQGLQGGWLKHHQ